MTKVAKFANDSCGIARIVLSHRISFMRGYFSGGVSATTACACLHGIELNATRRSPPIGLATGELKRCAPTIGAEQSAKCNERAQRGTNIVTLILTRDHV